MNYEKRYYEKRMGSRGRQPWVQMSNPLPVFMTFSKLLNLTELTEPQFPHLQNGVALRIQQDNTCVAPGLQ